MPWYSGSAVVKNLDFPGSGDIMAFRKEVGLFESLIVTEIQIPVAPDLRLSRLYSLGLQLSFHWHRPGHRILLGAVIPSLHREPDFDAHSHRHPGGKGILQK